MLLLNVYAVSDWGDEMWEMMKQTVVIFNIVVLLMSLNDIL